MELLNLPLTNKNHIMLILIEGNGFVTFVRNHCINVLSVIIYMSSGFSYHQPHTKQIWKVKESQLKCNFVLTSFR